MTLARGGISGGHALPTAPAAPGVEYVYKAAGTNPEFSVSFGGNSTYVSSKARNSTITYGIRIYKDSDNSLVGSATNTSGSPIGTSSITLTKGTSYYAKAFITDIFQQSSESAKSTSNVAATAPSAPLNPAASGGSLSASLSWSAPTDNGGPAITQYRWSVRTNTDPNTEVSWGLTTSTSVAINISANTYVMKVTASNGVFSGPEATSATFTVSAPPFFPSFGPFFPSFGPYFPSFGPSFPRFMFY